MKKYITLLSALFVVTAIANAQSSIDNVLSAISKNNKTIVAETQFWETQNIQFRTGLTPSDPSVNYDYMIGSPATAGNQTDFIFSQAFDFPTVYARRSQLANKQGEQSTLYLNASRQDILLEAKKICIALVYHNKLQAQLTTQKINTEKILSDFETRLNKGEGNILDVNKAKLQLIQAGKSILENTAAIEQLTTQLTALNGGNSIVFTDTLYFITPAVPPFEQLEKEYEASDPLRKILEQQKKITQSQIQLSKALWLPKMELGYHYQGILGQTYNGIHAGISIPLWENKNTVKTQEASLVFADLNLQDHRTKHYHEIKQLYEKYSNRNTTLEQYRSVFASLNNTALLTKALEIGHITAIEYFMELAYYNNAFISYLQTEKEFYEAIAELYKYQL